MKTKLFEFITYIILVLTLVFIGFYFGRSTVQVKTETKTVYIKGDTIRDIIYEPKPYKVNIPIDTELAEGEKVYTTGIGGLYKKGIPVGIIKSIKNRKNEIDRYAIVETFVNLDSLDMVGIIVK
jgi:cell shape-determining protein MreC